MSQTLLSIYAYALNIIRDRGDGLLLAEENPFIYNKGHGAYIEVWSASSQSLSWGFLEGAIVGMSNALYLRGKYRTLNFTL